MLSACGENDKPEQNIQKTETKLRIVTSIKPIQALVIAIAGEHAVSEQLIPDYASPHNYSFKPSDIRKVQDADVVFRIDEHMEVPLNTVFRNLDQNIQLISLAETKGLTLLELNDSQHEHENHESDSKSDHNNHESIDFHIWTSPKNSLLIATSISEILSKLDAKNVKSYKLNLEKFSESLNEATTIISSSVSKYKNTDYIVFHNSWQYFANEFGLKKPIVVDLHEGISSGAQTISKLISLIEQQDIRCVFYDASVNKSRLKLLTEKTNISEIDVLAKAIKINQSSYISWLNNLANQVETCLSH